MLAITVTRFGEPEELELRDQNPGAPQRDQVRVAVHAVGIGYADILVLTGKYQLKPPLPFVPGSEFAGIVEEVGTGVDPALVGRRVYGAAFIGSWGQTILTPAGSVMPLPDDLSFAEGATFPTSYSTSYYALVYRGQLRAGESLLVLGASGAVGLAAIQIGKALGAFVIGSSGTEAGRAAAREAGADDVVDGRSERWREDLMRANGDRPVDVVIDPIGGVTTELAFRSLAWNGRLLTVGFAAGAIPKVAANLALLKGASLIGVDNRQFYEKEPMRAVRMRSELSALAEQKGLRPRIDTIYPLDRYVDAINRALVGRPIGRIVIAMRTQA